MLHRVPGRNGQTLQRALSIFPVSTEGAAKPDRSTRRDGKERRRKGRREKRTLCLLVLVLDSKFENPN